MVNFDGILNPAAGWPDIPQASDQMQLLGGEGGPLNAQAEAIAARSVLLRANVREAIRRSHEAAGDVLVDGSFETGGTLTKANDVMLHEATGLAYRYAGPFPHDVDEDTSPTSPGFTLTSSEFYSASARKIVDNFTLKKYGVAPPTITVPAGTACISGSGSERAVIDGINLVGDGKTGTDGTMGVHWFGDV
ncbi:hypothetical protein ACI7MJ_20580, partial [Aeromonas caviae]|uniref:hypothetical protein n=1 Tax=Aeromonas caviae TaxID=648 RepID=UPI00385E400C